MFIVLLLSSLVFLRDLVIYFIFCLLYFGGFLFVFGFLNNFSFFDLFLFLSYIVYGISNIYIYIYIWRLNEAFFARLLIVFLFIFNLFASHMLYIKRVNLFFVGFN